MVASIFSLQNKVIAITGGYGYLGQAISSGLAEAWATVYVLGRDETKFRESFQEATNIFFQNCDISSTTSIQNAFKSIIDKSGKIDCLINNAFYSKGSDPENLTDEEWNYGIDGSLNSVYRCIREIIPHFKENQSGKIINVSSMYGVVSPDFSIYDAAPNSLNPPHYGAAKAGVVQLTKYFACYLGKYNVQVNAITPGPFPGPATQKNEAFIQNLKEKNPLGKIGKPEDLQGAFILLSSSASNFITGHNLVVDGGWTEW